MTGNHWSVQKRAIRGRRWPCRRLDLGFFLSLLRGALPLVSSCISSLIHKGIFPPPRGCRHIVEPHKSGVICDWCVCWFVFNIVTVDLCSGYTFSHSVDCEDSSGSHIKV